MSAATSGAALIFNILDDGAVLTGTTGTVVCFRFLTIREMGTKAGLTETEGKVEVTGPETEPDFDCDDDDAVVALAETATFGETSTVFACVIG
jgi:hypothetical protein